LQTIRELSQPTSDWGQYARQLAENQLITSKATADDDHSDPHAADTLMTTKCWNVDPPPRGRNSVNQPPTDDQLLQSFVLQNCSQFETHREEATSQGTKL